MTVVRTRNSISWLCHFDETVNSVCRPITSLFSQWSQDRCLGPEEGPTSEKGSGDVYLLYEEIKGLGLNVRGKTNQPLREYIRTRYLDGTRILPV